MLVPAKLYIKELTELIGKTITKPEYKWWHSSYHKIVIEIDDNFWSKVQLVKLNKEGKIVGYYRAMFDRPENYVESMHCVNFNLKDKMTFALGLKEFLHYLIEVLNVPKIKWVMYKGNPIEKSYDKLCKLHGGKIIGDEDYAVLIGNEMIGSKTYQWLNTKWICSNCGSTKRKILWLECDKCKSGVMKCKNPFGNNI